jgi:hypothetical protein
MKFVRYIAYLFYSYYLRGPRRNVAYLSSILGVTFLVYIQLMILALVLGIDNYIPMSLSESRGSRYVKLMLFMSPIFFLLYFGIKEKRLEDMKEAFGYEHYDKEVNHRTLLFVYLFLSFAALMTLAILRKP